MDIKCWQIISTDQELFFVLLMITEASLCNVFYSKQQKVLVQSIEKSINQLISNFANKKNILMGSWVISSCVCGDKIRYFKLYRDSGRST